MKKLILLGLISLISLFVAGQSARIYEKNGYIRFANKTNVALFDVSKNKINFFTPASGGINILIKVDGIYDYNYKVDSVLNKNGVAYASTYSALADSLTKLFTSTPTVSVSSSSLPSGSATESTLSSLNGKFPASIAGNDINLTSGSITIPANTIRFVSVKGSTPTDVYSVNINSAGARAQTGFIFNYGNGISLITIPIVITWGSGTINGYSY